MKEIIELPQNIERSVTMRERSKKSGVIDLSPSRSNRSMPKIDSVLKYYKQTKRTRYITS